MRQLIAQLLDVARAHEQDEVVRTDDLGQRFLRLLEAADVDALGDLVGQVLGLDAGLVLLARAVDVEDEDAVGAGERSRELVHQRMESRVAVRLEDDHQPAMSQLAGGLDGRAHLGRVVGVVVVDGPALEHA